MLVFTIYLILVKLELNTEILFSINTSEPDSGGSLIRFMVNTILAFDKGCLRRGKWLIPDYIQSD